MRVVEVLRHPETALRHLVKGIDGEPVYRLTVETYAFNGILPGYAFTLD